MNIFKTIIIATAASLFLLPAGGGVEANALSSLSTTSTTALAIRTSATSLLLLPRGGGIHALPSLSTTTSTTALAIHTTLSLSSFNLGKVEAACPDQCKSDGSCGTGVIGEYKGSCCRKLNNEQCVTGSNACSFTFGSISVGCNSCIGVSSCDNADRAVIGTDSCQGKETCYGTNDSNIANEACHEDFACSFTDRSNITDGACHGHKACQYLDYYYVGPRACKGKYSCNNMYIGHIGDWYSDFNDSKDDFITNNDGVCSDGSRPSYDIPENTCVGDGACYRCKNYLGCLGPNRCNVNVSNGDIDSTFTELFDMSNVKATCRLCRVSNMSFSLSFFRSFCLINNVIIHILKSLVLRWN